MRGIAVGVVLLACSWKLFVSRTYWHFPAIEEDPEDVERFRRGLAEFMQDGPPILTEDQIMQFLDHGWPAALLKRAPLDSTCPEASAPLRFSVHSAQHVVSPMLGYCCCTGWSSTSSRPRSSWPFWTRQISSSSRTLGAPPLHARTKWSHTSHAMARPFCRPPQAPQQLRRLCHGYEQFEC